MTVSKYYFCIWKHFLCKDNFCYLQADFSEDDEFSYFHLPDEKGK